MMRFSDEVIVSVSSGKGGNGCVAFRREAHVPLGGPAGGDGGRGGDVVFELRRNLRTLTHIRHAKHYKAQSGQDGMGKNRHGSNGADVIIPVPPGTLIRRSDSGEIIKDFAKDESGIRQNRWVFLRGGNGGWGNVHFKSSVNQAPRNALPGKEGETLEIIIELQLMADIGFVGFPNAGKSSLLDRFTNARPKIAPYPFTTKIPNLGVLSIGDRDIILADIPGIIEGAHEGAGLGIRFLKHISRTAALAFLIDVSDENYEAAFPVLLSELTEFSSELVSKKRIVIATKLDIPETEGRLERLQAILPHERVVGISTLSGQGLRELSYLFLDFVLQSEKENPA